MIKLEVGVKEDAEDEEYTLKKAFTERGMICIDDPDKKGYFTITGSKEDFGGMWQLIMAMVEEDWFMDVAEKLVWLDDWEREDVLVQARQDKKAI